MRRALVVAAAVVALPLSPGSAGASSGPDCRFALAKGNRPHEVTYSTRCDFEQRLVVVRPHRPIVGFDATPSLTGPVDPEDGFACAHQPKRSRLGCRGHAGEGVRLEGAFRVPGDRCRVKADVSAEGGADCAPGQACISVAYGVGIARLTPRGC